MSSEIHETSLSQVLSSYREALTDSGLEDHDPTAVYDELVFSRINFKNKRGIQKDKKARQRFEEMDLHDFAIRDFYD